MAQKDIQRRAITLLKKVFHGNSLTESIEMGEGGLTRDSSILRETVYGVLRHYQTLDYLLRQYTRQPIPSSDIRFLLLVAFYQLNFMRVAAYAVVNEAVSLASDYNKGVYKKLVNAVLRHYLRGEQKSLIFSENEEGRFNLPLWWVKRLQQDYPKCWQEIINAYALRPPLTLRLNRRRINQQSYCHLLKKEEIAAFWLSETTLILDKARSVTDIPGFAGGLVSLQDAGAQQAALLLGVQAGARVLDACAAPGGKTTHLLELRDCDLLALDIDPVRLDKVAANLKRLHMKASLKVANAACVHDWWDGKYFDYILADVPCTGSGVVKRHPDIRWLRRESDAAKTAEQQFHLLEGLWQTLAKQGHMLFSTCSIFKEENQQQLKRLLACYDDAYCEGEWQLLPNEVQDGFYYALLRKLG